MLIDTTPPTEPGLAFAAKAAIAAGLLKALANETRLLILCHMGGAEVAVGSLQERIGLSQSALSQHLAILREQEIVTTRRQGQTIYYRLTDPATLRIVALLHDIFCPEMDSMEIPQ